MLAFLYPPSVRKEGVYCPIKVGRATNTTPFGEISPRFREAVLSLPAPLYVVISKKFHGGIYFIKAPGELLSVPFSAATDFTVLADRCETFAETLIESNDPTLKMALCGRLNACLTLLQPTLLDPVPPHLIESLTVDILPANSPVSSLNAQSFAATVSP